MGEQWLRDREKRTELNYPVHVNAPKMFTACHFGGAFPTFSLFKYLFITRSYRVQKDICNNSLVR